MYKHIFFIGHNEVLKSKMMDELLNDLPYTGFIILPYALLEKQRGYYFHSYIHISDNDIPMSVQLNNKEIIIPDIINTLGVESLEKSLDSTIPYIRLEGLSYIQRASLTFFESFNECLYSDHHILGSISNIKDEMSALIFSCQEACMIEITQDNYEQVKENVKKIMSKW